MLVEVCANSLESALNAQNAGADRIELCSELAVGGVTPSFGVLALVRKKLNIPIHVLIRPRSGHFTYSDTEFEVMKADIEKCKEMGVEGIVSGVLRDDFSLDVERTAQLVELSKPLHFTFHRAFDWISDPESALKMLETIGVDTVLTSGMQNTALEGLEQLNMWQSQTQMTLMAGGGVNRDNAKKFMEAGLRALHLSGTFFVNYIDVTEKINMNSSKHWVEGEVAVTNVEQVRHIVQTVK
ncbi:copper homeostasis protein CutC [Flagellimonas meishanensis]|uniref:copper homeostasis protein CutC n=1 Tax=Flagellimonas meishanensis TaxID=2873264 RepID=UPI001CA6CD6F|nr:copper homeostasis protein CutC [[Muricauda] meishanensis]